MHIPEGVELEYGCLGNLGGITSQVICIVNIFNLNEPLLVCECLALFYCKHGGWMHALDKLFFILSGLLNKQVRCFLVQIVESQLDFLHLSLVVDGLGEGLSFDYFADLVDEVKFFRFWG